MGTGQKVKQIPSILIGTLLSSVTNFFLMQEHRTWKNEPPLNKIKHRTQNSKETILMQQQHSYKFLPSSRQEHSGEWRVETCKIKGAAGEWRVETFLYIYTMLLWIQIPTYGRHVSCPILIIVNFIIFFPSNAYNFLLLYSIVHDYLNALYNSSGQIFFNIKNNFLALLTCFLINFYF